MDIYDNLIDGFRQLRTLDGREFTKKIIYDNAILESYDGDKLDYAINDCGYVKGDTFEYTDENDNTKIAKLVRLEGKALTPTTCEIELTYRNSDTEFTVDVSSNTYQIDSNVDYQGNLLEISYTYPSDYELDTALRDKTISKSPTVSKDMVETIVTISHNRVITASEIIVMSLLYTNTLNLENWSASAAPAGTWKCVDISGTSNGDGTYAMRYVFAARMQLYVGENTWASGFSFDMFYRDERTGEPPADVVAYTELVNGVPNVSPGGIKKGQVSFTYSNFDNIVSLPT